LRKNSLQVGISFQAWRIDREVNTSANP